MSTIIRKAKIIDLNGKYHNRVMDLMIDSGRITRIAENIRDSSAKEISFENLHISTGWFDSSVCFGEPGYEERETITNGLKAASASGFTTIALQPNTFPVTDDQSQVQFVTNRASKSATRLLPIGALTKNSEGKDLAGLFEMTNAGAVAFNDYGRSLQNANLLKLALQYSRGFDGLVIAMAQNADIAGNGVVNEGTVSTQLGLKGIPALAEELQIAQNLHLLEYTGGRMHIPLVSTASGAEMIKQAKRKGLQVTCSVSVHHLVLTDETLHGFDTRYKVSPPLRADSERKALITAVKDGLIDMITSDHNPIDIEHKKIEFEHAKYGTTGLESAFGALMTVLPVDIVIQGLTGAYSIFNKATPQITEDIPANLTLFNPEPTWRFDQTDIKSKSKNSAFIGVPMKGIVYGIINEGKTVINK